MKFREVHGLGTNLNTTREFLALDNVIADTVDICASSKVQEIDQQADICNKKLAAIKFKASEIKKEIRSKFIKRTGRSAMLLGTLAVSGIAMLYQQYQIVDIIQSQLGQFEVKISETHQQ